MKLRSCLFACAAIVAGAQCALAQVQWDGGLAGDGTSWNSANNRVGDAVPGAGADVFIVTRTGTDPIVSPMSVSNSHNWGRLTFGGLNHELPATLGINTNGPGGSTARTLTLFGITDGGGQPTQYLRVAPEYTNGTITFNPNTNGTLTFQLGGLGGTRHDIDVAAATTTLNINANITELNAGVGFRKTGAGVLSLGGNNTFTGGVTIDGGLVRLANAGALNSTTPNAVTLNNNGVLQLNGFNTTVADLVSASTTTIIENGAASTAVLTVNKAAGTSTFAGILRDGTGGGLLGFTKTGAGTVVLSNANSHSGVTTILDGVLRIDGATAGIGFSTAQVNGGTLEVRRTNALNSGAEIGIAGGTLDIASFDQTVGGVSLNSGVITGTTGRLVVSGGTPLITVRSGSVDVVLAETSTAADLLKTGAGAVTLSRANEYTGVTNIDQGVLHITGTGSLDFTNGVNVNGGILRVDGSIGAASMAQVSVSAGATISGVGAIDGILTVNDDGILAPGTSPGVLTVGGLLLNDLSVLNFELGSGPSDRVDVIGDLTLDGLLNIAPLPGFGAGTYMLFSYTGTLTDNELQINNAPGGGFMYAIDASVSGQVNLIVTGTPIPEPAAVALLGMAVAAGGLLVRRRAVR